MLDVRRLRLLRELKIRGTLAGVADALAYSPSAVSQQLALLEKEVGVELLQKVGRRVQLTAQAEILVEHTSHLLDRLEVAEAEVTASLTTVSGTVRVAVFQSAAHAVIPQALTILGEEFPELRVEVTEREPEAGLFEVAARDFDLVIAEQYPGHTRAHLPGLDRVNLATDALRLAVPPASAALDAVARGAVDLGGATASLAGLASGLESLADTAGLPWVMEPEGTASRQWATQLCRSAGFEPDVRFQTADLVAHIRLIQSGNAVGILPDLVWSGEQPTVRLLDLAGEPHRTIFSAARLASAGRPGVVAVRDALSRAVAQVASAD
ncbi:LysR substrate-binding domain-containing protein [Glaciibacter sp. 2TAF33]|uniref:LysR substrate-binding domain-containing protein n=1 Tax=Glaciibacter sp. 2TAF33 TaxID=3233015 RepID=UPI003F90EC61